MSEIPNSYPGEAATADQIFRLADTYREAAGSLLERGTRGDPLSYVPCRLLAIHAIELYLSSLLRHEGYETSRIRGMQHDLSKRMELAVGGRFQLRKKTKAHLSAMTENREYVVIRYDPEMTAAISQINRLMATLDEVANKVDAMMKLPR